MESGVHVWSTPFGYCDDDAELCIKDEEEVRGDEPGGFPDPCEAGGADPLTLTDGDPLSIDTEDAAELYGDGLVAEELNPAELVRRVAADGLPSVSAVPEVRPASPADGQDSVMLFKAEPEDDSALTSTPEPAPASPPTGPSAPQLRRVGLLEEATFPPSPPLPTSLIDAVSGRELFTCKLCRKAFKKKMFLTEHYRTLHKGYRPYQCDLCGNRYFKETFVRMHRKLHTGEKDYQCHGCAKAFVNQARLTVHLKTARLCPASNNFDPQALQRKEENKLRSELMASERDKVIARHREREALERVARLIRPRKKVTEQRGIVVKMAERAPTPPEIVLDGPEIVEKPPEIVLDAPEVVEKPPEIVLERPELVPEPPGAEELPGVADRPDIPPGEIPAGAFMEP